MGPPDDPANYMGPVINERARRTILKYIEVGRSEGRLLPAADGRNRRRLLRAADGHRGRRFEGAYLPGRDLRTGAGGHQGARFRTRAGARQRFGVRSDRRRTTRNNREKIARARKRFFVGNLYINRKCTGAMVGAHPFGGFNMSGTDSKAGGPDYLLQFLQAKSIAERIV